MALVTGTVSYLAWRISNRQYTTWHLCVDAKFTLCGRVPSPPLSIWQRRDPPPVEKTCSVCRNAKLKN